MKLRLLLGMCVFAGGTLLALQSASAKDKKSAQEAKKHTHDEHGEHDHAGHDGADHGMGDMDPEMMRKWMEAMSPGEHHQHLAQFVGSWKYTIKWREGPGAPWTDGAGVSKVESIMGGRYIVQHIDGEEMMGMKFKGFGVTGYDNMKKKYVSSWMDNMGTGILTTEGTCDNSGKVTTFTGTFADPMTGKTDMRLKEVLRVVNNDKHTFEMWTQGPDGKLFLGMEIVYTRN